MYSIPSFYELGNCSDFLPTEMSNLENQNLSPRSMAEAKALAANNSHKEAERRRRKRINAHIATLKTILPNTIKTDKASLLAEAVRRVRELKKTTAELAAIEEGGEEEKEDTDNDVSNKKLKCIFPSETDELKVSYCDDNSGLIKASICCEDRPEIILEQIQALKSVKGKVMRAEMATVGGRIKSILWVQILGNEDSLGTLKRALKVVMDKSTLLAGSGQALPGNKRPRYYHF